MNIDPEALGTAAGSATDLLKVLSNPSRLIILCQLVDGERSVGALATLLGARDSTVSQHLALLRRAGLVRARRDGQTVWYSISSLPAQRVMETLSSIYCAPAVPPPRPQPPFRQPRRTRQ